jgi:hypothetical protein
MSSVVNAQGAIANAASYSNGTKSFTLLDANGDGDVTDFEDSLVFTDQNNAVVIAGASNSTESLRSWGDPHLDNLTQTDAQVAEKRAAAQALYDDLKDGTLNDQSLLRRFETAVTAGKREYTGDFQNDCAFVLRNGTVIEHDVAIVGKVAMNENIDIRVKDVQVTVRDIWSGNGGGGQSKVSDTSSRAGEAVSQTLSFDPFAVGGGTLPVFLELQGNNVQHGVQVFGADAGKTGIFLDYAGGLNMGLGTTSAEAQSRFSQFVLRGFDSFFYKNDEEQAALVPKGPDAATATNDPEAKAVA